MCGRGDRSAEDNDRDDEDALDLDLDLKLKLDSNFTCDQWFENEYALSTSIYG